MMNFKMKNKTLFLCLPAMLNIPFGGSSAFGANSEKDNKDSCFRNRRRQFQSPRGEGVVQTANPQTCMVMRQTRI